MTTIKGNQTMKRGIKMAESEAVKKSKVLVYGHMGEELMKIDKQRLLCCIQHDPDIALSRIAIAKFHELFGKIKNKKDDSDLKEEIMKQAKISHNFREFAKFFHEDMDELSRGSAMMGELDEKQGALKKLMKKRESDLYDQA